MKLINYLFLIFFVLSHAETTSQIVAKDVYGAQWVDSIYKTLSIEERIAQLIIIRSPALKRGVDYELAVSNIKKYNVGGVCFFKGTLADQTTLVDYYQSLAKTSLWFSLDGEWGLAMRLDSIPPYPRQLTLGAVQNDDLETKGFLNLIDDLNSPVNYSGNRHNAGIKQFPKSPYILNEFTHPTQPVDKTRVNIVIPYRIPDDE